MKEKNVIAFLRVHHSPTGLIAKPK